VQGTSRFEKAGVGTAIYARTGPVDRDILVGRTLDLVYDTAEGCVMRSRFWLQRRGSFTSREFESNNREFERGNTTAADPIRRREFLMRTPLLKSIRTRPDKTSR
jgi:hypothetical protein